SSERRHTSCYRDWSSDVCSSDLIVTHVTRSAVDVALAREQHAAYAAALTAASWEIGQVPAAEDCPDSVFVEDTVVVVEDLAVLRSEERRVGEGGWCWWEPGGESR